MLRVTAFEKYMYESIDQLAKDGDLDKLQRSLKLFPKYDVHSCDEFLFREVCKKKQLHVAKWLVATYPIDIHKRNNEAVLLTAINGDLAMLQWFLSLPTMDVHLQEEEIFRTVCCYGHLDVAKWLLASYHSINIRLPKHGSMYSDGAFVWSCEHGREDVARWLQPMVPGYTIFKQDGKLVPRMAVLIDLAHELDVLAIDYKQVLLNLGIKSNIVSTTEECNICCDDALTDIISIKCGHYFCLKCLLLVVGIV